MRVFIVLEVMVLLTIHALEQKKNIMCSTLFYLFFFYILVLLIIVFEGKQNTAEAGAREGGW